MKISDHTPLQAAKRFISIAKWPFGFTLVVSFIAVFSNDKWSRILVAVLSDNFGLSFIKFCFYASLFLFALAFVLRKWPFVFKLIHKVADTFAGMGFDASAVAAGACLGLFGGLVVELELLRAFIMATYLALIFVSIDVMLWVVGVAHKEIPPSKVFWKGAAISIAAFVVAALAAISMYCDTWPEIEELKLSNDERVCKLINRTGNTNNSK